MRAVLPEAKGASLFLNHLIEAAICGGVFIIIKMHGTTMADIEFVAVSAGAEFFGP